jgi:hypothetical protein
VAKRKSNPDFDVALSFAGEDRAYVEEVASVLREMGLRVFYDKYERVSLWGKDLYTHLREIYFNRARYTVLFISKHYKKKLWSNHERESAQARAFMENKEYILPVRFDKTKIPGILPTVGYLDLKSLPPTDLALLIKQKIGSIQRPNFFPYDPDRLYEYLRIPKRANRVRAEVYEISNALFDSLKLMTPDERRALAVAVTNTCPAGPPDNVHLKLDYLSRLTSRAPDELISMFARLDCLYVKTKVYMSRDHGDKRRVTKSSKIIEITYEPLLNDFGGNATEIMLAIFDLLFSSSCKDCADIAIATLDLSVLSTLAALDEVH